MEPLDRPTAVDELTCAREPIHIPGAIQPHGLLLAIDLTTDVITAVGGCVETLLGRTATQLLGQRPSAAFGEACAARISSALAAGEVAAKPTYVIETTVNGRRLDLSAHISGERLMVEAEAHAEEVFDAIGLIQVMAGRLQDATSLAGLLDAIASEVRRATGYDRVMVYRFLDDDSGEVVSESLQRAGEPPYLGLRYPATDIPEQARELYRKNWIRCIPDAEYSAAPLMRLAGADATPIDLSFSALRAVSPVHLEYLANMGVRSSMSLSILIGSKLWGLVACHAATPVYLSAKVRAALELFARLASLQLHSRLELDTALERIDASGIQTRLISAMTVHGLEEGLTRNDSLIALVPAAGVTVHVAGASHNVGETPEPQEIGAIVAWLNQTMQGGVYATSSLGAVFPQASGYGGRYAGLLALSLSRSPRDYVIWYLPEIQSTITWAGRPTKGIAQGGQHPRLSPRTSFAAWEETVRGKSRSWLPIEVEAAASLRVVILDYVLRQVDLLAIERGRSRDQLELLLSELEHRVKNTLATIQSVVRLSARDAVSLKDYTLSLERRIQSMAKTHAILIEQGWQGVSLERLIAEEVEAYAQPADGNVHLDGANFILDAQPALSLALVIHELTTNAVKHGCLSVQAGQLSVLWRKVETPEGAWLQIIWTERGGPRVSPPTRRGFGTSLLERVFANGVSGRTTVTYDPMGVSCILEIPFSAVHQAVDVVAGPSTPVLPPVSRQTLTLTEKRILLCEDNSLIALEMQEILSEAGAVVIGPFAELARALDSASTAAFDAAVLDIRMGDDDIWPLVQILVGRRIPLVLTTGSSARGQRPPEFADLPAIAKPVEAQDLVRTIVRLLEQRQ